MCAWGPGEGSMNSNHVCAGCKSPQLEWEEKEIGRADAARISNARQRSLNKARALAKQLQAHFEKTNQPLWVAVQIVEKKSLASILLGVNCVLQRSTLNLAPFQAVMAVCAMIQAT